MLRSIALSTTALVCLFPLDVIADCSTSTANGNTGYVCKGNDIYPFVRSFAGDGDGTNFTFEDLTADATNGSAEGAIAITTAGKSNAATQSFGILFYGEDFGIDSSQSGIVASNTGGNGKNGTNRTNDAAAASGGNGSVGGIAGTPVTLHYSGDLSARTGPSVWMKAVGGDGGDGGNATSADFNANAGRGGAGGASMGALVNLGIDAPVTVTGGGVFATGTGGAGGEGGKGSSTSEAGSGGEGGDGGSGGGASVITSSAVVFVEGETPQSALYASSEGGAGGKGGNGSGSSSGSTGRSGGDGGDGGQSEIDTSAGPVTVTIDGDGVHALHAASIGGTGGKGGNGVGEGGNGGNGGNGGAGGAVVVTAKTAGKGIVISGSEAQAIFARSLGGPGGEGGSATKGFNGGKPGVGAGGGDGGTVTVTLDGVLLTNGSESNAIIAQSVGGFAGNAGNSSGFVAYGASAQSGGGGGEVDITLSAASSITTQADTSAGVLAQSVGGGGGRGSSGDGLVAIGGAGSSGGAGGRVTVTNNGAAIATTGDQSFAIEAASVGGGGGSAGAAKGVISIGGNAGSGGNGGSASVTNLAALTTTGDQSVGLFVQSAGGGGGNAHATGGLLAIGGKGGAGGSGGLAEALNDGAISTAGDDANAVFVQSVGGGGGKGSNALSASAELSIAIGGQGGSGGAGGAASYALPSGASSAGAITTAGERAAGIVVQSVGGGGGHGGYAISANAGFGVSIALGAAGGGGNAGGGGAVTLSTDASVTTKNVQSDGLIAQSVGGGGGFGGATITSGNSNGLALTAAIGASGGSGGNGGAVTISGTGNVSTSGTSSTGVFAQSLGGGGGKSGFAVAASAVSGIEATLSVGGDGGPGGSGGIVNVTTKGTVTTTGDVSDGILAQSLGGSGGDGKIAVAASGSSELGGVTATIGAEGGKGGSAGAVTTLVLADVATSGDSAVGVLAQSVGGSGGNAGIAISGSISGTGSLGLGVGRSGGPSGNGAGVVLSLADNAGVSTEGDTAPAILAQSVARAGGNGGMAIDGSGMSAGSAGVSVGGGGGSGGSAGSVTAIAGLFATTAGTHSPAISAMSLGGGGGNGGMAISGTVDTMGGAQVTVGGAGGGGGSGGSAVVEVATSGAIVSTSGDYSEGIIAISAGGGGGRGGLAVSGSFGSGTYSGVGSVTIGGGGGNGGKAATVAVYLGEAGEFGQVSTSGYRSPGVAASSIGGSGGRGGSAYSGSLVMSSSVGVDVAVTVGGGGGGGNVAGDVIFGSPGDDVTTGAGQNISTTGAYSDAVFLQSVGGNGGDGGSAYAYTAQLSTGSTATLATNVGGGGGDGNTAGKVNAYNSGALTTTGDNSSGLYAQSVGGGGGRGGNAGAILFNAAKATEGTSVTLTAQANVGGNGGSGNHGNDVLVDNSGAISTAGATSFGIFAQSVGGGGGDGGSVSGTTYSVAGTCTFSFPGSTLFPPLGTMSCPNASGGKSNYIPSINLEIGGNGGSAGNGGDVVVTNSGAITTKTDGSVAIYAQSTGGGGGIGGYGALGTQAVVPQGTATEWIEFGADVLKEAISNTRSWQNVNFILGGKGGAAGDGGSVAVTNYGALSTSGATADAIQAVSTGGGGGNAGMAMPGFGGLMTLAIGGDGGAAGDGGDVTVDNIGGAIKTTGTGSIGIFAQSVGGSGGRGGDVARVIENISFDGQSATFNIGEGVSVQGNGGNGGNGGDIKVSLSDGGGITTTGDAAHGIFAQSVGGSGGAVHFVGLGEDAKPISWAGSAGGAGKGGAVSVLVSDASILVSGQNAHGIFAQSVSGSKSGTKYDNSSGDVTINVFGSVKATGEDGRGILAQSDGVDGQGQILLIVEEGGEVTIGADGKEAIALVDGTGNVLTNYGTIGAPVGGANTAYALRSTEGGGTFTNEGILQGGVALSQKTASGSTAKNTFLNSEGGQLDFGVEFNLGKASTFQNAGTMSPFGKDSIANTTFTGTLVQETSGVYFVDFDSAGPSDFITVVDGAGEVSLAGSVMPNPIGTPPNTGTSGSLPILSSTVGLDASNLAIASTATVGYSLQTSNNDGVDALSLLFAVDYTPWTPTPFNTPGVQPPPAGDGSGVAARHTDVGNFIDTLVTLRQRDIASGQDEFAFIDDLVFSVLAIAEFEDLLQTYDRLTPGEYLAAANAALFSSLRFADRLNSCPGRDEDGSVAFGEEGSCLWAAASGIARSGSAHQHSASYDERLFSLAGGGQVEIKEDWFAGVAFGYERFNLDTRYGSGSGNRFHAGAAVKREIGAATIAGSLSGGLGDIELTRSGFVPSGAGTAVGDPQSQWIAAHARADYRFGVGEMTFVTPFLDAGVTYVHQDRVVERGLGDFGLSISPTDGTFLSLNPGVEAGATFAFAGIAGQITGRVGLLALFGSDGFDTTTRLTGQNGAGAGYVFSAKGDDLFADLGVGIEATQGEHATLEATFDTLLGEHQQDYAGGLRLNFAF